ncbi:hypothetical protein NDU88_004848 [Pleurodeles waltl]|uniref:Murine leukemia virus integrase C-terminal domain-containing protein n=1 Tax=Pleurodeles waltl TaxID=8319 RepID=A0AAV7W9C9_PLEWA|nr:hypothetical protein NDU88_004848 [Pleurodeles waltl]
MGATAPVAHQQLRRLHSEPASLLLVLSRWAGRLLAVAHPPSRKVRMTATVEATTLPPIQGPGHALKAGDWVVIKKHVRKSCLEPRWKGPFQVILTTTTAVKYAGVPNWIHASHTKRVTCPTEEEVEALKSPVTDEKVPDTETKQREPGGEQAEIEEGEIFSKEETTDPFEEVGGETSECDKDPEGDEEPATGEGAGEPEQRRAFPEADDIGKEKENLIDLLGGKEKEAGQSEIVPCSMQMGLGRRNNSSQL